MSWWQTRRILYQMWIWWVIHLLSAWVVAAQPLAWLDPRCKSVMGANTSEIQWIFDGVDLWSENNAEVHVAKFRLLGVPKPAIMSVIAWYHQGDSGSTAAPVFYVKDRQQYYITFPEVKVANVVLHTRFLFYYAAGINADGTFPRLDLLAEDCTWMRYPLTLPVSSHLASKPRPPILGNSTLAWPVDGFEVTTSDRFLEQVRHG